MSDNYASMYEVNSPSALAPSGVQTSAPDIEALAAAAAVPVQQAAPALPVAASAAPAPAQAQVVIQGSHTLDFPITAPDGFEIKVLQLKRLKARELKGVDLKPADGKFGGMLKFVAAMNGLPGDALDELDAADVIQLADKVSPFLSSGTGVTRSR